MSKNRWIRCTAALALAACAQAALAHGDEPHGDEPHPVASAPGAVARFEASTESFEMLGRLEHGALALYINRFETGEPVLQAQVEVESGAHKAGASYRADQQAYVVTEPALLQALAQSGSHPVVVMVTAGAEADLLDATLEVAAAQSQAKAGKVPLATTLAGALGLGALGAGGFVLRRRQASRGGRS